MLNESGNSSIAFDEAKAQSQSARKTDPLQDRRASEQSIKFQHDDAGASEADNDQDATSTSVSIQLESENPQSVASRHHQAPSQQSHEDIHFDVNETPAPSSVQSVRFHAETPEASAVQSVRFHAETPEASAVQSVRFHAETPEDSAVPSIRFQAEDSRVTSRTVSKDNRAAASQPAEGESNNFEFHEEGPADHQQEAAASDLERTQPPEAGPTTPSTEEAEEDLPATQMKPHGDSAEPSAAATVPAPMAAVEQPQEGERGDAFAAFPPPRRLSHRAMSAARTPRANGSAPMTPRNRSPNPSYRPAHANGAPAAAAGVPPLVPEDENAAAERAERAAAAASKPRNVARDSTNASEFSSFADADSAVGDAAAAAVAAVETPASPTIVVTTHARTFADSRWAAVVETSRDTIERTVGNETAQAIGVEPQFVRVTSIDADADGMTCAMSIGHAPTLTTQQIDDAVLEHPYENTHMLLSFAAGGAQPSSTAAAEAAAPEEKAAAPAIPYSFSSQVGEGMLHINYCVFPFGSQRHMELSFDAAMSEVTIKFVKECLSEYLGVHESQLVVRHEDEVLADEATAAGLELKSGSALDVQCTIPPQNNEAEASEGDEALATPPPQPTKKENTSRSSKYVVPDDLPEKCSFVPNPPAADDDAEKAEETDKKKKKTKKAKKSAATKAAAPPKKKDAPAAAKKKTTTTTKAAAEEPAAAPAKEKAPKKSRVPRYAAPTQKTATVAADKAEEKAAKSKPKKNKEEERPLPPIITSRRRYCAHSPRPGAEMLEGGETMSMYMAASHSPSRDGTAQRSSRKSPARPRSATPAERASTGRQSAATPAQTPTSRARYSSLPPSPSRAAGPVVVPPQHTVRGVVSVTFRPRPVIQSPQKAAGHPHAHGGVEHDAETHSVTVRTHSPPPPPQQQQQQAAAEADVNDAASVDFVQEESTAVVFEEEVPQPHSSPMAEAEAEAEEGPEDDASSAASEVEFQELTATVVAEHEEGDNEQAEAAQEEAAEEEEEEEDPVPAAAPNPFV